MNTGQLPYLSMSFTSSSRVVEITSSQQFRIGSTVYVQRNWAHKLGVVMQPNLLESGPPIDENRNLYLRRLSSH